jgi:hypothetical protein
MRILIIAFLDFHLEAVLEAVDMADIRRISRTHSSQIARVISARLRGAD